MRYAESNVKRSLFIDDRCMDYQTFAWAQELLLTREWTDPSANSIRNISSWNIYEVSLFPPALVRGRPHSPFYNLTHRIPSATLKTSNRGSKGWKSGVLPQWASSQTTSQWTSDLKGVKQWYKRLVESPMDQQEEAKVLRKRERESGRMVRVERSGSTRELILSILTLNIGINWGWPLRFRIRGPIPGNLATTPRLYHYSNNGGAEASGVALITCSLHCASSWLKAPPYTPSRPRYQPSDPRPTPRRPQATICSQWMRSLTGDPSISR